MTSALEMSLNDLRAVSAMCAESARRGEGKLSRLALKTMRRLIAKEAAVVLAAIGDEGSEYPDYDAADVIMDAMEEKWDDFYGSVWRAQANAKFYGNPEFERAENAADEAHQFYKEAAE